MSWSYSGDPGNSDLDTVRFLIGDTDTNDEQLSNEEILWILDNQSDIYRAAKAAVRNLIAKFSRLVDKQVGDLRIAYSQRLDHYKDLLGRLDELAAGLGSTSTIPAPYAGGISISDRQIECDDSDRVAPQFHVGMDDTYDASADEEDWED